MLEAVKVSVELIMGRKRDFRVSLLLLPFILGFRNVHLSASNGRRGTAKRVCEDHGEGKRQRLRRGSLNKLLAMGCNSSGWSSEIDWDLSPTELCIE